MKRIGLALLTVAGLALGASACSQTESCARLAERLCAVQGGHCVEARAWIDAQAAGDAAARDAACAHVLADPQALAAYTDSFVAAMTVTPAIAPAAVQRTAPGAGPSHTPPTPKPTTRDKVREVGETIEELGNTGEKAGGAINKLEEVFSGGK